MSKGPLAPPYRALTIGMVTLVSLVAFEAVAVTTAMPTVARALHGLSLYALAFGGALAAGVIAMVISGRWSDGKGPAAPLWTGVATFVAGLIVAGAAQDMWTLVVGRVAQGFGGGLVTVALYVVVGQAYPAGLHPRVFSSFAGAWVVPSIAGPSLAGLVVEHLGWRWVFLGMVLLTAPAVLLMRPGLRGLAAPAPQAAVVVPGRRTWWAVGAATSMGLLYVGGQQRGVNALILIGLALAGLAVFTPRLLPRGTFAVRPGLPSVVLLRGLAGAAFIQADVFIPLMLTRERGFSPAAAGLTLTIGGVSWFFGSWYQGRRGQRLAPTRRLQIGLALICVGIGTAVACVAPVVPVWVCAAGWTLAGFGMGLSYPTMSALTLRLSKPAEQGANSSALQLADSIFSTTILAVGGTLFASWVSESPQAAYLGGFAIAEALALVGLAVAARAGAPADEPGGPGRAPALAAQA
ncbi:MFS transporter [Planosporangium mesophilum]|uniref:MFS transporter n=1 Tax=Planosporangium mesophilum TaxID=689768 RepID=A0A8J3X3E4_9ACTN|nr:MFS transporter [Planosporangium mesophilum]GII25399.1 MFS transporter [Planosporangium mesophilum]